MPEHPIERLARRYPQLLLPIDPGMKDTQTYKDAVLRGKPLSAVPDFAGTPEDALTRIDTPAGEAEILYMADRADFVHALRALAYRCEPAEIPDAVGASTIRGLINWEKIRRHREVYLAEGGTDWDLEFKRFTAKRENYLDCLILLSAGDYSAVSAETVGLSKELWREKSLTIRKYHELTHFVCRTLFPEDVDAVRDEVLADAIGLLAAFGTYDTALARRFLGIENGQFREGGRLSHYAEPEKLPEAIAYANEWIEEYALGISWEREDEPLSLLLKLF